MATTCMPVTHRRTLAAILCLIGTIPRGAEAQRVIAGMDVSGIGGRGIEGSCGKPHTALGIAVAGETPLRSDRLSVRATARMHLFPLGPNCVADAGPDTSFRTLRAANLVDSRYVATDAVVRVTPWADSKGLNFGAGGGYVWREAKNIPYALLTGEFAFGGPFGTSLAFTTAWYRMRLEFRDVEIGGPIGFGGVVREFGRFDEWRSAWSFGFDIAIPVVAPTP